jgi:prepilin-type N-terminal cleavage/methylation domain-containing protein/prepilin-type processing-associated H-X9-DG protein
MTEPSPGLENGLLVNARCDQRREFDGDRAIHHFPNSVQLMNTNVHKRFHLCGAGFTLVELLVVIAIIGALVALLLPAVQAAREAARRTTCESNLRNVALAVLTYESAKGAPPEGMTFPKAAESDIGHLGVFNANWIIKILPYLEQQSVYDSFDLKTRININTTPLATNRNYNARGTRLSVLLCPSDPNNSTLYDNAAAGHGGNWARTNYAGNSGNAFLYSTCSPEDLCSFSPDSAGWKSDKRRGVMGPNVSAPLKRMSDGTSRTILAGEIRTGLSEKDGRGVWALGHAGASLLAMFGSEGDANGPNACYPLSDDVYSDVCGTSECKGNCMDCDSGYFAQATVRSLHPGGAHVTMCDGSVTFISDDVETSGSYGAWGTLWDRMIASADGGMSGDFPSTSF